MELKYLVIIAVLLLTGIVSNAYAGGPRYDSPETSDPDVGQCWIDGFDDGANNDYSKDRSKECDDHRYEGSNVYRQAFDVGLRCLNPDLYEPIKEDCDAARGE